MRKAMRNDTFRTVSIYKATLCLECATCGHRKAWRDPVRFTDQDMNSVGLLLDRLICSACGGKDIEAYLPMTIGEAAKWVEAGTQNGGNRSPLVPDNDQ